MIPFIIGALGLIAYGMSEENNKPKALKKMARGGNIDYKDRSKFMNYHLPIAEMESNFKFDAYNQLSDFKDDNYSNKKEYLRFIDNFLTIQYEDKTFYALGYNTLTKGGSMKLGEAMKLADKVHSKLGKKYDVIIAESVPTKGANIDKKDKHYVVMTSPQLPRPTLDSFNLGYEKGGTLETKIDALYKKSEFINDDYNWESKLLEMLQDGSVEAYQIYQKLTAKEKKDVLQELFEMENDMGADGDGEISTSKENLKMFLEESKNGKKYARGGGVRVRGNAEIDKKYSALKSGSRVSERYAYVDIKGGGTYRRRNANQYGKTKGGNEYREYRNNRVDSSRFYADGGKVDGNYYVFSSKKNKIVSKGFSDENEAKKHMYKMYEKDNDFSLSITKK